MILVLAGVEKNIKNVVGKIVNKNKIGLFSFIFLIAAPVFLAGCFNEAKQLKVSSLDYSNVNLPQSFAGKKIIFISDIHYGCGESLLPNAVQKINSIMPDYLVIGGDMIDKDSRYIDQFLEEINKVDLKIPIYAVLGNHDNRRAVKAELIKKIETNGRIHLINNSGVWLTQGNDRIRLSGVGSLSNDTQLLDKALDSAKMEDFSVLVTHEPDYFENMDKDKVDLVLSGHLHGGQMTFHNLWHPLVPTKYLNKYMHSIIRSDNSTLLITKGLGNTLIPVRLGSQPEINVINLSN